MGAEEMQ